MQKTFLIIIFNILFLLCGTTQITTQEKIVFEDMKESIPIYVNGDTLTIENDVHSFIKSNRAKTLFVIKKDGKLGVIDADFKFVIAPEISGSIRFENYGIEVTNDKAEGLFDFKGNELIPIQMKGIYSFYDGVVHYIDTNGRQKLYLIKTGYHTNSDYCDIKGFSMENNLVLLTQDCLNYGIVSLDSINTNINYKYQNPKYVNTALGWILSYNEKVGVLGSDNTISIPFIYEELFKNREAFVVKLQSLWGIVNFENKPILPIKYSSIEPFNNYNNFLVNLEGKFGVLTLNGNILIPLQYNQLKWNYSRNVYQAKTDNGWGLISDRNRIIIPFQYDHLYDNSVDGYIVSSDQKYGVVSYNGRQVIPSKFKHINIIKGYRSPYPESGYHVVDDSLKSSFFNLSGKQETGFVFDEYEIHGSSQPIKVKIGDVSFLVNALGHCVEDCPSVSFLSKYGLKKKE